MTNAEALRIALRAVLDAHAALHHDPNGQSREAREARVNRTADRYHEALLLAVGDIFDLEPLTDAPALGSGGDAPPPEQGALVAPLAGQGCAADAAVLTHDLDRFAPWWTR